MKGPEGAWEAVERLYKENGEGLRQLAAIESEERDWRHYVTLISLEIQDTIPPECDIDLLNAVRLLVRENNALRRAVGLPSYHEMATLEEKERHGEAC
jgi:hypothetical protein